MSITSPLISTMSRVVPKMPLHYHDGFVVSYEYNPVDGLPHICPLSGQATHHPIKTPGDEEERQVVLCTKGCPYYNVKVAANSSNPGTGVNYPCAKICQDLNALGLQTVIIPSAIKAFSELGEKLSKHPLFKILG